MLVSGVLAVGVVSAMSVVTVPGVMRPVTFLSVLSGLTLLPVLPVLPVLLTWSGQGCLLWLDKILPPPTRIMSNQPGPDLSAKPESHQRDIRLLRIM